MAWLVFLILFFLFPKPSSAAEIPLFYQLLQAYQPMVLNISSPPLNYDSSGTNLPSPQVLGVATNIPSDGPLGSHDFDPPSKNSVTIAVLGDSMIETLGDGIPNLQKALTTQYPDKKFRILNYGLGSSNIESGLNRLTQSFSNRYGQLTDLVSQKPDIVVVESFAYNNYGNSQAGFDKQWLNLGAITTTLKQKLPNTKIVMAATIAPNSVTFANGIKDVHYSALEKIEKTTAVKLYLQNLVHFATSQHYPLADAYHPSLSGNEGRSEFISSSDHLHPSDTGNQFFCNTVAKAIYDNGLL